MVFLFATFPTAIVTISLKQATRSTLLTPEEFRRNVPASGSMYRGRGTVEVSQIIVSVGKREWFDMNVMPLSFSTGTCSPPC